MKDYKYILFDLDGTISDPKIGITKSVAYALNYFQIKTEDLNSLCKFIGPPLMDSFIEYYGFNDEEADLAVAKYREYYAVKGIYENTIYNGIEELMQNLKARHKVLIVATSKPIVYATKILEHFKLLQYFDFISGSELNGERTKKSEVIEYALKQNNIDDRPSVIMIGDREHDINGAVKVGIDSIGILYGYGNKDEFERAGASFIVGSVKDLEYFLIG